MAGSRLMPWELEALHMLAQGHGRARVGELVHRTASALGLLVRKAEAQRVLRQIHQDNLSTIASQQTAIQVYAPKAIAELILQLDDPDVDVRFRAARWIAESAGHTPLRRLEVTKTIRDEGELESLTLEELRARALENIQQAAIETTAVEVVPDKEQMN